MNNEKITPKAITPRQAAALYGFTVGQLCTMRYRKQGPRFYRTNSRGGIRYMVEDFEAWLKQNPVLTVDSFPKE